MSETNEIIKNTTQNSKKTDVVKSIPIDCELVNIKNTIVSARKIVGGDYDGRIIIHTCDMETGNTTIIHLCDEDVSRTT